MPDALDVEAMSLEQLRDEVWYWREETAAGLGELLAAKAAGRRPLRSGLGDRIAQLLSVLSAAVSGDIYENCFACGLAIHPGDAVISDVTEGEMHAECPIEGRERTIRPGDKVFMDPESIVTDEDHPEGGDPATKPDHIVAHAHSRLYTPDQILAQLERARVALASRKAA